MSNATQTAILSAIFRVDNGTPTSGFAIIEANEGCEATIEALTTALATGYYEAGANGADIELIEIDELSNWFLGHTDLRNADLRNADLNSADLNSADLRNADLRNADLRSACLNYANLEGANLEGARLGDIEALDTGAYTRATAWEANFNKANLRDADLSGLDAHAATFKCADLAGATVNDASIEADLKGTVIYDDEGYPSTL